MRELARAHGVTLFMAFLAVWQAVLQRLSGQPDLAVGTPVANRNRPEIEEVVGFFVNMLALRTDFRGSPSFAELLGRVRRVAMAAYDHTDVPFERLVDELSPGRDLSRQPLVQVMFTLEGAAPAELTLPGVEVEVLNLAGTVAKFDLTLELFAAGAGWTGHIEYNSDLFDRPTVARLAGHFANLAAAAAAAPQARLIDLALLSAAERQQIVGEWNDTDAAFPETTLLHQFFEAAVERAPESVAAVCAGQELTYAALEARSNRLARLLRDTGVERGTPVGVWVERSFELLSAVLGVLKAGGHYVALDDTWPAHRVESILEVDRGAGDRGGERAAAGPRGDALAAARARGRRLPGDRGGGAAGRIARPRERRRAVGLRGRAGGGPGDGGRLRQRLYGPAVQRGGGRRVPRPRAVAGFALAAAGLPGARDRQRLGAAALGAGSTSGPRHRRRSLAADSRTQP